MKRAGHLLPRIAERGNLVLAFWKAARGRRNSNTVRGFAGGLDERLRSLSREILDGSVTVGEFARFVVFDPKQRTIHAAPFRERVLHHAIMNICGPHFERGAIDGSCACRAGKGNRAALVQARRFAARKAHFLKMDIRRYFDSVDHDRLQERLRRLFKDAALLRLLDRIVESYQTAPGQGLPIGTLTSQYFANFYLDALDRHVKEGLHCRCYVRFMDDFALWHDSADQLGVWREEIALWLQTALGLKLKPGTRLLPTVQGMPFLGFRVLPGRLLLDRRARRRFRLRLTAYEEACVRGRMGVAELQRRVEALLAHTDQAQCRAWRRRVLALRDEAEKVLPP
ncbi:MAG: RNA-directed DNA polymerase [Verrucomicrobiota bacterium]